ncbi:uncharacterized protein [Amphiura filiformis]|uniref:uncharacterized protein n=1 Tax=Amphiura filiformis TaxID=82378 RepID=UPI003B21B492
MAKEQRTSAVAVICEVYFLVNILGCSRLPMHTPLNLIDELANEEKAKRQTDYNAVPDSHKSSWFARQIGLYQPFRERFPDMCASRTTITVLISTGGKANKKGGASYFVVDGKNPGWKEFTKFSRMNDPDNVHDQTTIVVNGMIYIVGGTTIKTWPKVRRVCTELCWTFSMDPDVYIAGWRLPPNMLVARRKCGLAYLKPHLYVIGGLNNKGVIDNVERFVIADYRWEVMPPLPQKCHYMSVVVWQSMLIVYGCHVKPRVWEKDDEMYTIQVFDTKMKKWFGAGFTEAHCSWTEVKPAIMEHEGRYYRVIFQKASQSSAGKNNGSGDNKIKVPGNDTLVQELIQEIDEGRFVAKMGKAIDQSGIPPNKVGAFRIADDVFVNASGYIHKTGLKVNSFPDGKVDLGPWKLVNIDATGVDKVDTNLRDSVTCLTYDTKITKRVWRF